MRPCCSILAPSWTVLCEFYLSMSAWRVHLFPAALSDRACPWGCNPGDTSGFSWPSFPIYDRNRLCVPEQDTHFMECICSHLCLQGSFDVWLWHRAISNHWFVSFLEYFARVMAMNIISCFHLNTLAIFQAGVYWWGLDDGQWWDVLVSHLAGPASPTWGYNPALIFRFTRTSRIPLLCQGAESSQKQILFQMAFHSSREAFPVPAASKTQSWQTELCTNRVAVGRNLISFWLSYLKAWAFFLILAHSLSHNRKNLLKGNIKNWHPVFHYIFFTSNFIFKMSQSLKQVSLVLWELVNQIEHSHVPA